MKLLITPAQVAQIAFRAPDFITPEAIPESTILAAQQKYIRPVFGARMCERLAFEANSNNARAEFLREYLLAPIALYVKALLLPSLALQVGAGGVAVAHGDNLQPASEAAVRAAVRRLRADARALMLRAVEFVENAPATTFVDYDASKNILHRCSVDGGVVLEKRGPRTQNPD